MYSERSVMETSLSMSRQCSAITSSLETFYDGFDGGWRWSGFGGVGISTTTTKFTKIGPLVVDIFDGQTQKLSWRG
jgi:hypothetical protein